MRGCADGVSYGTPVTAKGARDSMTDAIQGLYSARNLQEASMAVYEELRLVGSSVARAWPLQPESQAYEEVADVPIAKMFEIRKACKEGLHSVGLPLRAFGHLLRYTVRCAKAAGGAPWSAALFQVAACAGLPAAISPMGDALADALMSVAETVRASRLEPRVAGAVVDRLVAVALRARILCARGASLPDCAGSGSAKQSWQSCAEPLLRHWLQTRARSSSLRPSTGATERDDNIDAEAPHEDGSESSPAAGTDLPSKVIGVSEAAKRDVFKAGTDGSLNTDLLVRHTQGLLRQLAHTQSSVQAEPDAPFGEVA